jgi:hypothetical protein
VPDTLLDGSSGSFARLLLKFDRSGQGNDLASLVPDYFIPLVDYTFQLAFAC